MRYQNEVITLLKELTSNVNYFPGIGWWHFKYGSYQMVYIPDNLSSNLIRSKHPVTHVLETRA